jgi:hypothetical protein
VKDYLTSLKNSVSSIVTLLHTGQTGVPILAGSILRILQTRSRTQLSGYRDYFPVVRRRRHVLLWLRMSGAIPQPTIYTYMAWTGTPFYLDEKCDGRSPGVIQSRLVIIVVCLTGLGKVGAIRLTTWKYSGCT